MLCNQIKESSMSSTNICDIPIVCLAEIATYLDDDSLMNMTLTNSGFSTNINSHKEYIQKKRFFNTFSANPYKHHKFNNCPEKLSCISAVELLDKVADICDTEKVVEELVTQYACPYTAFQWHLENGKNNMYITNLLVKADFSNNGHIWIYYGNNALRVEFLSEILRLIERDPEGYYHLFLDKMLLIPKLVKGFRDLSSDFFLEVQSSSISNIRVIRQKVNMEKANNFIKYYIDNRNIKISMPRVAKHFIDQYITYPTILHRIGFLYSNGCVAICLDIRSIVDNKPIGPEMIDEFRVFHQEDSFCVKPDFTHNSVARNYGHLIPWYMLMSKDCYIVPVNGNCKLEHLHIDVHPKENVGKVMVNAFIFNNDEHIYFSM